MNTITMHVEVSPGEVVQHGFHLGTDMGLARQMAEERFHSSTCLGVFLERNGRIEELFDGDSWYSRGGLK